MAHEGYLVIADISGYTAYLDQSELDHARDSLNSFLTLLVDYTRRPLLISRLEGDAVISYALREDIQQGWTLVELVQNTYLAFRKARDLMVVNTTCACRACQNIPNLDLKFFIHFGTFSFQGVKGFNELVGSDVNLIHRLTKNSIVKTTGITAYAAYTQAAAAALNLDDDSEEVVAHAEQYDHIGKVDILVQDLNAVWQRDQESLRFEVRPEDTLYQIEMELPLSPPRLWDYLTRPEFRAIIHGSQWQKLVEQPGGRIGPGTVYECSHGTYMSRNTIVDWHPYEQYTTYETTPVPRTYVYVTYRLERRGAGTRLTYFCSRTRGPLILRKLGDIGAGQVMPRRMPESFAQFRELIDRETGAGHTGPAEETHKEMNDERN